MPSYIETWAMNLQGPGPVFVNENASQGEREGRKDTARQAYFSSGLKRKERNWAKGFLFCSVIQGNPATHSIGPECRGLKTCALPSLYTRAVWLEVGRICLMGHDFHLLRFPGSRIFPLKPSTIHHQRTVAGPRTARSRRFPG